MAAQKTVSRKTLLYKSKVEYAGWTINHAMGCSHGCKYPCYAMMLAKRYGRIKGYKEWVEPKIVENAVEVLEREIPRMKDRIESVHLCFMTDPFMYRKQKMRELSLRIIELLAKHGIRVTVLTKGVYPQELADVKRYGENNSYGITLVSLDEGFRERYEPFSAPLEKRLAALKRLHENGLNTWVSMEPYPTPNIIDQNLTELIDAVSFVDKIIFGKMNYSKERNEYRESEAFYEYCSREVINFCMNHLKEYHIKEGTIPDDDFFRRLSFALFSENQQNGDDKEEGKEKAGKKDGAGRGAKPKPRARKARKAPDPITRPGPKDGIEVGHGVFKRRKKEGLSRD